MEGLVNTEILVATECSMDTLLTENGRLIRNNGNSRFSGQLVVEQFAILLVTSSTAWMCVQIFFMTLYNMISGLA